MAGLAMVALGALALLHVAAGSRPPMTHSAGGPVAYGYGRPVRAEGGGDAPPFNWARFMKMTKKAAGGGPDEPPTAMRMPYVYTNAGRFMHRFS